MNEDAGAATRAFELLADPMCRRIVGLLALRPRRAAHLVPLVGLDHAALARSLRRLVTGGLVRAMPSPVVAGSYRYGIEPAAHGPITAWLAGIDPVSGEPRVDGTDGAEQSGAPASRAGAPVERTSAGGRAVRRRWTGGTRGPPGSSPW
ncbi:MAG TPA: winged helix-turn-helix domain-containing protein [Candidatus Limnocylindrales bacterium]|nr:winged helix-turn-helix domain-containing protein [Candidatus Limnocylindrales bacterium]